MRAPRHLTAAIREGLIDSEMTLSSPVIVPVAPHRRDEEGWPSVVLSAVLVGPGIPDGVAGVWATGDGAPVLAVDGAALEFSIWPPPGGDRLGIEPEFENWIGCPEVGLARKCALLLEEWHRSVRRGASRRVERTVVERRPD